MMSPLFDFINGANLQAPTYPTDGSVHTAPYGSPNTPLERQTPSHFVVDTQLLQKMQERLQSYVTTRCGERPVTNVLRAGLDVTRQRLAPSLAGPHLRDKTMAAGFFWENIKPVVTDFVTEVDGRVVFLSGADTTFGARPDAIWGERVHVEFKSPRVFLHYMDEISAIGRANNGNGTRLVLRANETGARSIIFKVFLPNIMVSTSTQQPVRLV